MLILLAFKHLRRSWPWITGPPTDGSVVALTEDAGQNHAGKGGWNENQNQDQGWLGRLGRLSWQARRGFGRHSGLARSSEDFIPPWATSSAPSQSSPVRTWLSSSDRRRRIRRRASGTPRPSATGSFSCRAHPVSCGRR